MAMSNHERARLGGIATRDKYGKAHLREIAARGRKTQAEIYGPDFQRILAENGHQAQADIYGPNFYSVLGRRGVSILRQNYTWVPVGTREFRVVRKEIAFGWETNHG